MQADATDSSGLRVFQGITGSAGQPAALARALRAHGVTARSAILGANPLKYAADEFVDCQPYDFRVIGRYLAQHIDAYDVFHLHMRPMMYQNPNVFYFPTFYDLALIKAAGKRICFHFRGSEVRHASVFREKNPFHYVDDDPDRMFAKFREPAQRDYIRFISAFADRLFVTDPELQTYVPGSHIVPRIFEPHRDLRARPLREGNPVIIHAPSRRGVKGTDAVLAAIERLRAEGHAFEFRLVEGLPNDQALKVYADSDIIVDQLRIGWYGVLAVEGLALGRAVVSYVRDDLVGTLGEETPIAVANPRTVYEVLLRLVTDFALRAKVAQAGRAWFDRTHSPASVVPLLIGHYEDVLSRPPHFAAADAQSLVEYQFNLYDRATRKAAGQFGPVASMSLAEKFDAVRRVDGLEAALRVTLGYLKRRLRVG